MKVSYSEGVASHTGSESCACAGNCGREALTGVRAGRVLSREIHAPLRWELRSADVLEKGGRRYLSWRKRESRRDPARSETPCMHASTSIGNREILRLSAEPCAAGRIGKSKDVRR